MRLIPGPTDVLKTATTLTETATRAVEDVGDLVALLGRAADLMARAEDLVTSAEASLARADAALDRAEDELDRSAHLLDGAQQRLDRGDAVLDAAETAVGRGEALLAQLEPVAGSALPKLQVVADSVEADEIRAVVRLVDHLPALVSRLETNVVPALEKLDDVGPEVHQILESVTTLSHAIAGLPGIDLLQRRGERKEDELDQD